MPSEHYFSPSPESELSLRPFRVRLAGHDLELLSAGGIFSPARIDVGTQVLLAHTPGPPRQGELLDLGCGWGPLALTMALESPDAHVWAVDVNERALDLVRRNADRAGVRNLTAARPDDVPDEVRFAAIWSNPPIRVGKSELHGIVSRWLPRLEAGADAWLVVQRNLGSDSLHRWMQDELADAVTVTRSASSKGFRVLRARRSPSP